jgi:ribosomal protein S18 acetylase RimI-like enzyme
VFTLRRYEDADFPTVWHLHVEGLEQVDARAGIPRDEDLRAISATYLDDGGEFLVGTVDGTVVAMGALARVSDTVGEIRRVRVDVRYQRRGFGRTLLHALERRAVELGYTTVRLDTTTTMTAAHRLYASAGYREVGRGLYPSGRTKIILQKQFTGCPP